MYNMPNARVAVIDDDRMVREMLELGLSREGYEVRTAMDGKDAPALTDKVQQLTQAYTDACKVEVTAA